MNHSLPCSKQPQQNTLDETLRYLHRTIRYGGGDLLAIRFKYRGIEWSVDTAEEAIAVREKMDSDAHPWDDWEEQQRFWTPDKFIDAIDGIGDLQKKLLVAIHRKPGISSRELVLALGMDSEVALAGVISGLSKQLKKMGIEPSQVLAIKVDWKEKIKNRTFLLDDFFVGAGAEQNWPAAWEEPESFDSFASRTLAGDDPGVGN